MRVMTSRTTASARRRRLRCRRAGRTQGAGIGYGPAGIAFELSNTYGPGTEQQLILSPSDYALMTVGSTNTTRQTQVVTPEQTGAMSAAGGHDGGDAGLMDAFTVSAGPGAGHT